MRIFDCDHCRQPVYFDNRQCVSCHSRLGFHPARLAVVALEPVNGDFWRLRASPEKQVRFCANSNLDICNWLAELNDENAYCVACRHNRLIPNTGNDQGIERWRRISQAQRHLFYSLLRLRLPHPDRQSDPAGGLVFDFLEDQIAGDGSLIPAMTGHEEGLIAIRVAEADDVTREQARASMDEPYRTLLGHFRHEVGHFMWDRLVRDRIEVDSFRTLFGDERDDYGQALQRHYEQGPILDWQDSFISAYASVHPWEDFAECFAHYLHIVDTLETARSYGMSIDPRNHQEMAAEIDFDPYRAKDAEQLLKAWIPISLAINAIQRSMGQPDFYPFVLTPVVIAKLDYLHDLLHGDMYPVCAVQHDASGQAS
ncbi:hypothetical protein GR212_35590 [Rhizobium lusitanum]|uniref:Zinc-ribbon domain-containing protein n=1 Tax=Rhizobium lusitanum TaxID=293958 RepID=A0A6L9UGW1_9HYPH|nr:putative zinc-binding metallopeptidase [Rhizobium lusitanum]NEI74864.1 hypothetical protein [Rhizobium lusitanum]